MTELIFLVEEGPDGGFVASAVGVGIYTQAETREELVGMVRDAVRCHYDGADDAPRLIRLHYVRDEVVAL